MPRSKRGMGRRAAAASPFDFAGILLRCVRRFVRRADGRRGAPSAAIAARICATISRSRWKRPFAAAAPRSRCPPWSPAKPAAARAPKPGHDAETCPTCAGHGKVRATQGFFTIERTCAALPRHRQDHPPSLQDLPRRGHGAEGAHADRRCAARRRGRHPHPPFGRRRGGRQWRPARRSLYFPVGGRTPDLPARRPRSALPRPGLLRHRGAGRQRSKCRPWMAAAPR